jgi:hypothetical protein
MNGMLLRWKRWAANWLRLAVTSGTEGLEEAEERRHRELARLLDRQSSIPALDALVAAIKPAPSAVPLQESAIALDANVFLRLGNHAKSTDIVDYLSAQHSAPLILPGQAVQEFWNNQLHVVDTVAAGLKKRFDALKFEFQGLDPAFGDYGARVDAVMSEFVAEHGHVYEDRTIHRTLSLLEMLRKRASVPYAPRLRFTEIAAQRKRTKTPPGFKDDGDGDFFIWVDLLNGLMQARDEARAFKRVILVTQDVKKDWSRAGMAHPILVAEVAALLGVPFETWTLDQLAAAIANVT